jgi:DNA-binding NtrC family response regulator
VVQIAIPPLRERREDIPQLVRLFIEQLTEGDERFQISQAMMDRLASRAWPGNVRELRNVVERAVVMEGETEPAPAAARPETPPHEVKRSDLSQPYKVARAQLLERFEVDYLKALLERNQGNLSQSARDAKINRVYLLRLLDKYDMRRTGPSAPGK